MCQWLPLPNVDCSVCFVCKSFRDKVMEVEQLPPLRMVRVHDRFWPAKAEPYISFKALKATLNVHNEQVSNLYYWWLGQKLLEEL